MDSNKEYIAAAVIGLFSGKSSEREREDIKEWISRHPELGGGDNKGQSDEFLMKEYRKFLEGETQVKTEIWELIEHRLAESRRLRNSDEHIETSADVGAADEQGGKVVRLARKKYLGIAVAASFLLIVAAAWYAGSYKSPKPTGHRVQAIVPIKPASQGAILTLSDGTKLSLDSAGGGLLGRQGQVSVMKSSNGELKYLTSGPLANARPAYNKLSTPKGRQFKLELPDGSKVWLNAGSSLEYPVAFTGDRREVILEGEAYFEIEHDKQHPFFVKIPDGADKAGEDLTIQVLGTSFNAMAYRDEGKIQTTLLEGSVRLSRGKRMTGIRPGEAATIGRASDEGFAVEKVDVEKVMSWKNGMFKYDQASLAEIMRDISRWYDVDVRYEGAVPDLKFDGAISRSNSLDKILTILQLNHVIFRMEGRTIVVTK
jgi:ferric-dicitrate binding protein FerR (iron transport regulator)